MIFNSVVFPQPLGPRRLVSLPRGKVKVDAAQRLDIAVGLGKSPHFHDGIDRIEHR